MRVHSRIAAALVGVSVSIAGAQSTIKESCKIIPGDSAWPSTSTWSVFNASVGGALIKTVPIGTPCFSGPLFNATQCQNIQDNWENTDLYLPYASAFQDSIFSNDSCNPFLGPSGQCIVGQYPEYAVNVSSVSDITKTITFAKSHNIRLIVKNTGHDFMGRVSGHGTLSIWTHNLQQQEWFDTYKDPWSTYIGPAFRAQAGVMGHQLYGAADARGYHIVGGECPTVGFVGGYIQAGGHSVMSGFKGIAADQVLSFEVITTTGHFVNASGTVNPDLFWALRGGGGGNYGIVWTVTVKAYHDVPVSVATFSFTQSDNGADKFAKAHELYQRSTPNWTADNAWILAFHSKGTFIVPAFIMPNTTLSQLTAAVTPLFQQYEALGLNYTRTLNQYAGYWKAIQALPDFADPPVNNVQNGGRLIPLSLFSNETAFQGFLSTLQEITDAGFFITDAAFKATLLPGNNGNSSVYHQWRTSERLFLPQAPFAGNDTKSKLLSDAQKITAFDAQLSSLVPGGMGAYLNEADPNDPNWKADFYGPNYDQLLNIKDRYDPDQLLWGKTSVGSDRWAVQADGRLCPA